MFFEGEFKLMIEKRGFLIPLIILMSVMIKVLYFRYELFNGNTILNVLSGSILWIFPYFLILLLIKKYQLVYVFTLNLLGSALMIMITWYERYFLIVPSYYDLSQAGQAGSVMEIVPYLYSINDLIYFIDSLLVFIGFLIFKKVGITSFNKLYLVIIGAILLVTILIQTIMYDKDIYDVSFSSKKYGYINTQISQMVQRSFKESEIVEVNFNYEDLIKLKGNDYVPDNEHKSFGLAKDRHLFVIQVESMQELVVGQESNNQEITPNINELLKESTEFTNVYQQIGAGNTSDSEWLLHTSLYPKGVEPTVNFLTGKPIPSMVDYLNKSNYKTMTFHADEIEYWNRDMLYPVLKFQKAFTDNEIPNEDVIGFGPSDSVLFDFVTEQVDKRVATNELVYANILTLTSHTPFEMPDKDELLTLPDEYEGTYVGNYMQSVRYTDEQIGHFVKHLKDIGIYDKSVIVVFGDHSGLHGSPMTENDNALLSKLIGHPYSLKDRFTIPFIVTVPGVFQNHVVNTNLGGQIDMMPTLMNLLGIEINTPIMGQNLFHYKNNLLGMRYYLPNDSFINNEYFYINENARFPKRFYSIEDMNKIDLDLPLIDRNIVNVNNIINISDSIVNHYTSEKNVSDKK